MMQAMKMYKGTASCMKTSRNMHTIDVIDIDNTIKGDFDKLEI